MKTVGVIGGMGPEATTFFMQRVLASVDAADDAEHVPLLVDQNPQIPSRIKALIDGTGEDPSPVLVSMARRLEKAGAEALVMPCNTAHHFAPAISDAVAIPLINMVDLAAAEAARLSNTGAVGLLGSPALTRVGVYDNALEKRGIRIVPQVDPVGLLAAIKSFKSGQADPRTIEALSHEALSQSRIGAGAVCVCCTEFSLVAHEISAPVPVFDALDLLVDATVRFSRGESLPTVHTAQAAKT